MRKFTPVLLAFALLCLLRSLNAAESVTQIVFTNGASYDSRDIPVSYKPIVEAIREVNPKATFTVRGERLLVGLSLDGVGNKEVLAITWQSDCPVNSQYRLQQQESIIAKVVKPTLIAWTKVRHPDLQGSSVQKYSQQEGSAEVVLNAKAK